MISIVELRGENFKKRVTLDISGSSRTAIIFPQESAMREFIRILLCMKHPLEGYIEIDSKRINNLSGDEMVELRKKIGVLFQDGGLISNLKVWENITLPILYHRLMPYDKIEVKGIEILKSIGFDKEPMSPVTILSLFEKRLVSMARLTLLEPPLIIYENIFYGLSMDEKLRLLNLSNIKESTKIYLLLSDEMLSFIKPDISVDIR